MTYRPDKPILSRAVCNDRIKSVRVNLIGDNLGAGVTRANVQLRQSGSSHLRRCDGGGSELVAYNLLGTNQESRVAQIQAGINAPNQGRELAANTDHLHMPLLAGPWELMIDQRPDVEPMNKALKLENLDDIEIIIEHEASTLQN